MSELPRKSQSTWPFAKWSPLLSLKLFIFLPSVLVYTRVKPKVSDCLRRDRLETVLAKRRERSWYENRVGNRSLDRTVCLAFPADVQPFRITRESSKLLLPLSQRFPLQNQKQIVVRLSDRHSPEPELLDSMLLEQSQRIVLKAFQQSWQAAGNAMEDS